MNISTKTGDKGESGLANGMRLPKDSLIFEVLGTLDELNSWIGLCVCSMKDVAGKKFLLSVQDTLFHLGAEIADSHKTKLQSKHLEMLEKESGRIQATLDPSVHTRFLLPGGTQSAAQLDITRTVCRRLERILVRFSKEKKTAPLIMKYLNRLSDYLYALRCAINEDENHDEITFTP